MSDDVISAGHEISKPCYFMPVYTSASVQKCPHVDVSKKKKKDFKDLFCIWENASHILKRSARENGCQNASGQMTLHSAQSRRESDQCRS